MEDMMDIENNQEEVEIKKEKKKEKRPQTLKEEIGNSLTHGLGAIFGIIALVLMLIKSDRGLEYMGSLFFGISIILLYLMSCLYHSFKNGTKVKRVFRRFDHASIYLLIGGTFAPILLCGVENFTFGLIFFIIQWVIIVAGIVFKSIDPGKLIVLHVAMFLILGWSGVSFMPELIRNNLPLFWLILSGGICYTIGVYFFMSRFKFAHLIWHFACLFGTILHFIGIYGFIL